VPTSLPIVPIFALGVLVPPDSDSSLSAPPATTEPIAARQTVFAIPFQIPPAAPGAPQPVEVQLSVSRDGGRTWQHSGRAQPDQRGFMFRAPGDGEYAFAIRTLVRNPDGTTGLRPPGRLTPGLRVVVDTQPPKVSFEASQGQAGQITANWQIDEANFRPGGLSLQYREGPDGAWQTVAVPQQNLQHDGSLHQGSVTWWPQAAAGTVEIRAEVTDLAGNPAVNHAQVSLGQGLAGAAPPMGVPTGPDSQAPQTPPPPPQTQARVPVDSPTAPDGSARWQAGSPATPPADWPPYQTGSHPLADRYPGGGTPAGPTATENRPAVPPDRAIAPPDRAAGLHHPQTPGPATPQPPYAEGVAPKQPAHPDVAADPNAAPPAGQGSTWREPPDGEQPRMVNSRLFELEYDVESVGPSGIARVELWATRNGGRSWEYHSTDDDNRSPLLVKVDEEGIYGFKVVITSGAGLGGQPPRPGDPPDVTIGVDLTRPVAQILSADQGIGPETGKLVITWDAHDAMLAPRPVTLSYGDGPGGSWVPIAADLGNTGRYAWAIPADLPSRVYLRLEVRDEAGNIGVHETSQTLTLDRSRPAGHIRDVRSLGPTADHGPKRYRFLR